MSWKKQQPHIKKVQAHSLPFMAISTQIKAEVKNNAMLERQIEVRRKPNAFSQYKYLGVSVGKWKDVLYLPIRCMPDSQPWQEIIRLFDLSF